MSWADNSSGSDDRIEIGAIRCQYCDQPFLEEMAKSNHELSCKPDDDGDSDRTLNRSPDEDNEDFVDFCTWLRGKTDDGPVHFQSRSITDSVGLTPNQIGVFMASIRADDESGFTVKKLSYSDRTLWEVTQA